MADDKPKDDGRRPAFVVNDRRLFKETGDAAPAPAPPGAGAPAAAEGAQAVDDGPIPAVDFPTFVISLASSVMLHLGEVEHPATGKAEKNLEMARHTLEVLGMLSEKTKGNLTGDEDTLMQQLLYDLRLRYVAAVKKG